MSTAILTKFFGPTNQRGSRVRARAAWSPDGQSRSVTLAWDHGLSSLGNHQAAAMALATKLEWDGEWYMGDGGDCYVFVRSDSRGPSFLVAERVA